MRTRRTARRLSTRACCFLGIVVILGALVVGCSEESGEDTTFQPGEMPDEVFTDFVTQESDSGLVKWKLTAPRASKYKKRKTIVLEKPLIKFYDEAGQLQTTLESDSGQYYEDSHDMLAFGNVVVESTEGDVLETDSLMWVNSDDKIISNSFVKLTRGRDVVTGIGLECDHNLSSVNIKRNVKATIHDEAGEMRE